MFADGLKRFGRLLGLPERASEDALYSERVARAVLSRRSFLAASSAITALSVFSFPTALSAPRDSGALYVGLVDVHGEELSLSTYERMAVARDSSGWDARCGLAVNADTIAFPMVTHGEAVADGFFVANHLGERLVAGPVQPRVLLGPGISMLFGRGAITIAGDVDALRLLPD